MDTTKSHSDAQEESEYIKEKQNQAEESSDEEDLPKGGCPVMRTTKRKRNPALFVPQASYRKPYVSPFYEFLSQNDFFKTEEKSTDVWRQYPIYLRESLFYFSEKFKQVRNLEVGYKFFSADDLKEQANKLYHKGDINQAINTITKAISFFKWLECTPDEFPRFNKQQEENKTAEQQEFENDFMNKLLFTVFHDQNVTYHEYKTCASPQDKEMEAGILFNLYSNLAAYYVKGKYFLEARQVIDEMFKLETHNSLLYFRKAQVIAADAESTIDELETAIDEMEKALLLKESEEIFKHNEQFLQQFNLQNHNTIFGELLEQVQKRKIEEEMKLTLTTEAILKRVQQINRVEADIISRGMVPEDGPDYNEMMYSGIDNYELRILQGLLTNYYKAVQFFQSDEDKKQVKLAQEGYSDIVKLNKEFNTFWKFDMEDERTREIVFTLNRKYKLDLEEYKILKRIEKVKKQKARELMENPQIDIRMYSYVLEQIMKEEEQKKKHEQKEQRDYEEEDQNLALQFFSFLSGLFLPQGKEKMFFQYFIAGLMILGAMYFGYNYMSTSALGVQF